MAKYAISKEGILSLEKLSNDLVQIVREVDDACRRLYACVQAEEDDLGIFAKDIYICLREVIAANQQGKEGVAHMVATAIPHQIAVIEDIMEALGGSDDDDDEPPRLKLTLGRHR